MLQIKIIVDGKELTLFQMVEKSFSTGSRGYHSQGKLEIDGKKFQANFLLVEIGSKNAPKKIKK